MGERSPYASFVSFVSRRFPGLVRWSAGRLKKVERMEKRRKSSKKKSGARSTIRSLLEGDGRRNSDGGPRTRMGRELMFIGLGLEPEEVMASAVIGGIIVATLSILTLLIAFVTLGVIILLYIIPIAFIAPLAAHSLLLNYPLIKAKRLRIRSLGSMPEAVTYMAMSLKLTPSVNKAVEFAARNTEEPLAKRLRSVLWDVYCRKEDSIEDSFMGFANDLGEWNEDLKRSLYGILAASGEGSREGVDRGLERAQDTIREGAKRRMEEFVASLKMPTTAFFALCVLLPLIIGSTLPVLSIGGIGVPSGQIVQPSGSQGVGLPVIVLLDIVFPVIAFVYSLMLLGRRPGTSVPPRVASGSDKRDRRKWVAVSVMMAAVPLPVLMFPVGVFAPVVVLWSVVLGVSSYLLLSTERERRGRREVRRLEQQMPDALFIIGSRLGEGMPVEQALARASESMKGMEIAGFLERVRFRLQLQRRGLEETLFGREGMLRDYPSRVVRVSLKMMVDFSRKDPTAAGKALVDFSHYLRGLQEVERDLRSRLGEVVDAMRSTATFFAPLVLGITCALYMLLARSFESIAPLPLSTGSFVAALGIYLVVMVPVIVNFCTGLESGGDAKDFAGALGKAWPLSLASFTIATVFSVIGLGS